MWPVGGAFHLVVSRDTDSIKKRITGDIITDSIFHALNLCTIDRDYAEH